MGKRQKFILILLISLVFCVCLGAVLYPLLSNYYAERHQSQVRTEYDAAIEEVKDDWIAIREAARRYNHRLASGVMTGDQILDLPAYDALLDPSGTGVMGYVIIPKLDVELPIYHGDTNAALDDGAAHLQGTSLPVGGESTHAVISGHTGMADQRMFTDLDTLAVGDTFYLDVLGERLAYEVDQILTVLPHEVEAIRIVEGEDYVTLLTCTPYGVNSHRLLVRGHRIGDAALAAEPQADASGEKPASTWLRQYWRGIRMGLSAVGVLAVIGLTIHLLRKKRA